MAHHTINHQKHTLYAPHHDLHASHKYRTRLLLIISPGGVHIAERCVVPGRIYLHHKSDVCIVGKQLHLRKFKGSFVRRLYDTLSSTRTSYFSGRRCVDLATTAYVIAVANTCLRSRHKCGKCLKRMSYHIRIYIFIYLARAPDFII